MMKINKHILILIMKNLIVLIFNIFNKKILMYSNLMKLDVLFINNKWIKIQFNKIYQIYQINHTHK